MLIPLPYTITTENVAERLNSYIARNYMLMPFYVVLDLSTANSKK